MKKLCTYVGSFISALCLIYFTIKYYWNQKLTFNEGDLFGWSVIVLIILITLLIGIINNIEIKKVKEQNKELITIVKEICNNQENICEEVLVTLQNSREISLDIYNEIKKGD